MRGFGATPASAFEQAACALTAAISHAPVASRTAVEVQCEAPGLDLLFVEWLNVIIYEIVVRKMVFGRFSVSIEGGLLLWGERPLICIKG